MSAQPQPGHSYASRTSIKPVIPRGVAAFVAALLAALALAALGVLSAASPTSAAPACTRSWDSGGATNVWDDADNWDGAGNGELPVATDHVCIGAGFPVEHGNDATTSILSLQSQGTLTLSSGTLSLTDTSNGSSVAVLIQSGGTLGGAATLTVLGTLTWTAGDQSDAGRTVIDTNGAATIDAPATIALLHGRIFENKGTTTWVQGTIALFGAAPGLRTTVLNGGTMDAQDDLVIGQVSNNPGEVEVPLFRNTGTFTKSAGIGTMHFLLPIDNDGTMEATSGTIRLTGPGDGASTGAFATSASSLIEFVSDHTLGTGATFEGNIHLEGGTLTLATNVTVPDGTSLSQAGGTIAGTSTLTVLGAFEWTAGEHKDAGRTVIAESGIATIDAPSGVNLKSGRIFENKGTTTWIDGPVQLWGAAPGLRTTFENAGVFEAQNDSTMAQTFGNGFEVELPLFHNTGTFVKTGGTTMTGVALPFDNDGIVETQAATIRFGNGGSGPATGSFSTTQPGALLEFRDGTFELGTGANIGGDVLLSFATLNLSADASAAAGTFTQSGGVLGGNGTLNILDSMDWTGGIQKDAGRTLVAEGATATLGGPTDVMTLRDGRTLENQGSMTWSEGSIVVWRSQPQTRIENSGSFVATGDNTLDTTGGINDIIPPLFHNTGTFAKTGGAGETRLVVPFTNEGTVAVDSGTLAINGDFDNYIGATRTLQGGTWRMTTTLEFNGADIDTLAADVTLDGPAASIVDDQGANGLRRLAAVDPAGTLTLDGGADLLTSVPFRNEGLVNIGPDSEFTSTGFFEQADGTTTVAAATSTITAIASEVRVTGGQMAGVGVIGPATVVSGGEVAPGLSPGTIHASGTYQQGTGGTLHVEIGGTSPGSGFDVLAVSGSAHLGGTLDIETIGGFTPSAGDSFRILTTAARTGEFVSLLGTDLGNGLAYTAQYDATGVTLFVTGLSLSIDDVTVSEGNAGTVNATFTVTLSEPAGNVVTVDYTTADDTAFEPDDYTAASDTLTFQPGQTSKTVVVAVHGDTLDEDNETFVVDLSNATNAPLAKSEGIGTITDDDPFSMLSIAATDAALTEGNAGFVDATFTVTLTPATGRTVSVGFATAPGTATSPADFAAKAGTVTFDPGETTQTIEISVKGDTAVEPDETFFVDLSSPVKAVIGTARATGTILDDDEATISVGSVSVDEGNTGTTDATFPVTLSAPATETVIVNYATADQSAMAPDDYLPASGTITWAPGQTTKSVTIKVVGDTVPESNETFLLNLTNPVNAAISDDSGTGTIADDGDIAGTPDFQMLITPSRQVLEPGGTTKYAIQAIGLFGFDEPITLSTPGLPAGITASFSVNPLNLPGTSILTLTADPDVFLGEEGFVVRGTGGGLTHDLFANTTLDFGLVPICFGSVEGFVTDAETGAPVKDAIISINPEIKTDTSGFYRIDRIQLDEHNNPIEDYPVRATKPGYWDDLQRGLIICDGVTTIDLELLRWRPASVSGTVVEGTPDGTDPTIIHPTTAPIDDAQLVIRDYGSDRSDAAGAFSIDMAKLNPGNKPIVDAQLEVTANGYWSRPSEQIGGVLNSPYPLGTIDPDEHIRDLIVPLVKKCTATLTGHVTDAVTGTNVANARVTVAWPIAELNVHTDSLGRFTYPGVLLGHNNTPIERSVDIQAPGYVEAFKTFPMNTCLDTPAVEIALVLAPPPIFGTLQGHVYDAVTGLPIEGALISTPICATPPGTTCTGTDANGFYRLQNVPLTSATQPVEVFFSAAHRPNYYTTSATFLMRANATTEHDFRLSPTKYARLTGFVRDRFSGLPIEGAGASGAGLPGPTTTDVNGHYLTGPIELPAPGDPTALTLRFDAAGYWGQTKSKAVEASTVPFELDFDLLKICEDATVQGTVVNAVTQQPIAGADVAGGGRSTTTASNGTYKLEHLQVGTDNTPIDVTITVTAQGFHPQRKTVKVFCNATLTIDFGRPPERGTIIVRKTTNPADSTQSFAFEPTWTTTPFELAGGGSKTFTDLAVGSGYSVKETLPQGWQQESATCSDGSPVTNINLAAGETVTCTFVNRQQPRVGTIVITKTTDPIGSAASFAFTRSFGAGFSLKDGQSHTFSDLAPGSGYSVSETVPDGWEQRSATCSDGSPVTNIDLSAGETVTCTFVNRQLATLIIGKTTDPSPDPTTTSFGFTAGGGLSPTAFSLADGGSRTFANVVPGTGYTVAEDALAGWQTPTATCSDGSPVSSIDLAAGETVTCTFINRPRPPVGTIVIAKTTEPAGSDDSFAFTRSWGAGFSLKHGQSLSSADLVPASGYSVAETVPDGWQQRSATCSDGSPITNIDLAAGEIVTCTFVNRRLATLVIRKQTQPSPDPSATSFAFTAGGGLSPTSFNLANGGSRTFANVSPVSGYSVAETVPAGWQQPTVTCSDGSPVTNIDLAPGESVTCTFVNRRRVALDTGAHTIGFWQNKNGQGIIKKGAVVDGACASGTWLRQFKPFQDLAAKASCDQVAAWETTVIKAASSSGSSMNAQLKAQSLATALSVFFSDPALGGNKIGSPTPVGGITIDLKTVCKVVDKPNGDGTCSGIFEDVSSAFGGAPSLKVIDALTYAAGQSNVGGSTWYGNVKKIQELAKDLFDAINNNVAFGPP